MKSDRSTVTDNELIGFIKDNQRDAFETLYKRYFARLYCVIYKRVKSKEVTEEIIQDMFTDLWIKRDALEIRNSFAAYIHQSVKYQVYKFYKREDLRIVYTNQLLLNYSETNSTEETLCFNELTARFDEAMSHLPEKSKKIFVLSRKEYKSNKEIASQLGITEKAVEYHITKSLGMLKGNLKEFIAYLMLIFLLHR